MKEILNKFGIVIGISTLFFLISTMIAMTSHTTRTINTQPVFIWSDDKSNIPTTVNTTIIVEDIRGGTIYIRAVNNNNFK
jgi:hypothetical protein